MKAELNINSEELASEITRKVLAAIKPLFKNGGVEPDTIFTVETLADYLHVKPQWVYERTSLKEIPAKGNTPATANRHLATLKHMFTKAVEWEMVEEESLKRVRKVKLLAENNKRLRYLSKEECNSLINQCLPHLKPIVKTALNTGMRKGEILSLEWEKNIDLKHGFILLSDTKNGERREIPINQTMRETLQRLVRRIDSPYVFVDGEGKRFGDVKKSFKSALRRAGIKDFTFHDLRHTFASHLVMAGVDLTTIKELLGHKSIAMTLRYSHLAPSHKRKAMELLEDSIGEKRTIQKLDNFNKKRANQNG